MPCASPTALSSPCSPSSSSSRCSTPSTSTATSFSTRTRRSSPRASRRSGARAIPRSRKPLTFELARDRLEHDLPHQLRLAAPGPGTTTAATPSGWRKNNGLFWAISSVRLAAVTDGTSHTIALGEKAHCALDPGHGHRIGACGPTGDIGDTLFSTLYPLNPQKKIKDGSLPFTDASLYWASSASSLHPGGANFAMLDGSVRFLKDSIDCWSIDPVDEPAVRSEPGRQPRSLLLGPRPPLRRLSETRHTRLRRGGQRRGLVITGP